MKQVQPVIALATFLLVYTAQAFGGPFKEFKPHSINKERPNLPVFYDRDSSRLDENEGLFTITPTSQHVDGAMLSPRNIQEMEPINNVIADTKLVFRRAEAELATTSSISNEVRDQMFGLFHRIETELNHLLGSKSKLNDEVRAQAADFVTAELRPYMKMSPIVHQWITKPLGYTGDYKTIDWVCDNKARNPEDRLASLLDEAALNFAAPAAARARRDLVGKEIEKKAAEVRGTAKITSLACGPAREIMDRFLHDPLRTDLQCTLIDLDKDALDYVKTWRDELSVDSSTVSTYQRNVIYLMLGKEKLDTEKQDLIYSMGLLDYLKDKAVVRLLNYVFDSLKPGGKVIFGQFHVDNPSRGIMESIVEWHLVHRNEDDMKRLFRKSKFGRGCTEIIYDDTGAQMLACCEKRKGS